MFKAEMTISEMLSDPLIHQVLEADGTSVKEFAALLEEVRANYTPRGTVPVAGQCSRRSVRLHKGIRKRIAHRQPR